MMILSLLKLFSLFLIIIAVVRICPVFSIFDSRLKERHLNELLFQYVQADLEFVERSFADEEQYSEQD
jgi:hypothetical protein